MHTHGHGQTKFKLNIMLEDRGILSVGKVG